MMPGSKGFTQRVIPQNNPNKAWFLSRKTREKSLVCFFFDVFSKLRQADTLAQMAIDQNHTGHFDFCRALGLINGWIQGIFAGLIVVYFKYQG